jgi:hypothetical protein
MDSGERVGFDFVGIEDLGQVFDLNQRSRVVAHKPRLLIVKTNPIETKTT